MSKTVSQIKSWLLSASASKVLLVEVAEVNITSATTSTLYFSSKPYVPTDTNIVYNPCIVGGISYTESLSYDGQASLNFGDIELDNTDGSNDVLFSYIWNNRPINIYIGDASWPRDDFSLIFSGIVSRLETSSRNSINLVILDRMTTLNTSVSDKLVGTGFIGSIGYVASLGFIAGYTGSQIVSVSSNTILRPICLGECFNVSPALVSPSYYTGTNVIGNLYQVHDGAVEDIIEVRDNGAPINFLKLNSYGMFALTSGVSANGTVTASVQGDKVTGYYGSNINDLVKRLLTGYGSSSYRLSAAEYADTSNTPNIGYYINNRENVLDVCNQLAASGGYQIVNTSITADNESNPTSAGKVKLVKLTLEGLTAKYTVDDNDMFYNSMYISEVLPVRSSIKLSYCKNWTTTETVAEGLNINTSDYFKNEWLYNRYIGSQERYLYRDSSEALEETSYLLSGTDANAEILRRFNLLKTQRYIVTATYLPHLMFAQLGEGIQISTTNQKFSSIVNGKTGLIYSIQRDWINSRIVIGVMV